MEIQTENFLMQGVKSRRTLFFSLSFFSCVSESMKIESIVVIKLSSDENQSEASTQLEMIFYYCQTGTNIKLAHELCSASPYLPYLILNALTPEFGV